MINQKEFFKKLHPDQFSDSKIVKKGKLDRNFLDFYLETLTSKSLEKSFENFCRTIAEAEICPNLLPQTGPTGGGDSKVDSETYPVAESLSALWYYGDGNKAASERWAFAISAKKEWKTKIKSDVDKIVKVNIENNRSYSKIFFMSNQYISDKKRADTEDDLRKTYNIDVRILDRTWLLEKALKNQKNIETTINAFGLSDNFSDEVELGDKDYKRRKEYDEIESQICTQNIKPSAMVSLSQKSLILARELEFSKQEILGIIDRNNRIAREVGTPLDIANSIYDAAWTIFWWYPDEKLYYEFYKEFEEIVISENNVKLFENLITLWISLFSISKETEDFSVNKHAETIKEKYVEFISDTSKPNTILEAKAVYQPMRIFLNDSTDDIVDNMILIVKDSFGHLDLNLNTISRLIQEFSIFEDAQNYNELFELIVSTLSKQKQKSEAAKMLTNRGRLLKDKKPYEALAYFSRAIMSLYNEADKSFLINVILEMGNIFENIGLFWAARNFYYYDFCLCLNQYFKYGEVHQALLISSYALKCVELKLGHILYAVKFDELLNFAEHIYPDDIKSIEEERNHFDYILGIQILRTKYKTIEKLCRLPAFLENQGMYLACASIKYKLGHYDETILKSLNDDTDAFDDLINKMQTQPVIDELTFEPWYGVEPSCIMKTNLLGCSIELHTSSPYDHGEIEFGASILAVLESFFGTGILNSLLSLSGKMIINLCYNPENEKFINCTIQKEKPNIINVFFGEYNSDKIVTLQEEFSSFLIDLIAMATSIMFPMQSELEKIEKMIKDDAAFDRIQSFTNSVFYGIETLGINIFDYETIVSEFEDLEIRRSEKSTVTAKKTSEIHIDPIASKKIHYGKSPGDIGLDNVSNEEITTASIINVPLWNASNWKGVMFICEPSHSFPPVLSFAFTGVSCKSIFEEWINELGHSDNDNEIGIRIIKGIDKNHPYWYRVAIGPLNLKYKGEKSPRIISMPTRLHTMQPDNALNLKRFENELNYAKRFLICPSYFQNITAQPQVYRELYIYKNIESILICDACDIREDDFLSDCAIMPFDDPIIPKGKENAPILSMIKRKKQIISK